MCVWGSMCVSVSVFVSLCALSCMAYAMHIHNVHLHTHIIHSHTHTGTLVWHIERCVWLSVGILFNTFALALYFFAIFYFGASYFMLCSHSSVSHCRVPYMENSARCRLSRRCRRWRRWRRQQRWRCQLTLASASASQPTRRLNYNNNNASNSKKHSTKLLRAQF